MLSWPDATVIISAIAAFLLWKLRDHLKRAGFKRGDTEAYIELDAKRFVELQEQRHAETLPEPSESIFTKEELRSALEQIRGVDVAQLSRRLPGSDDLTLLDLAYDFARNTGVVTKKQLRELTASDQIREVLTGIYREELHRSAEKPLDPIAIATWGSYLYLYGINETNIARVRAMVRQFPEYYRLRRTVEGTWSRK